MQFNKALNKMFLKFGKKSVYLVKWVSKIENLTLMCSLQQYKGRE